MEASYREWAPAPSASGVVACRWVGQVGDDGTRFVDRVLPDACVDLVWDGHRLEVAGPDTGPVLLDPGRSATFVGVRFRPGAAGAALGLPAATLRDRRVDADDVLGRLARHLPERLAVAPSAPAAATVLEAEVAAWLRDRPAPDPLVRAVVRALAPARPPGGAAVATGSLARELGVSERQLLRRCDAAVGYGPKVLDRVLRFRRFLALAERSAGGGLAALAVTAGYADQAHLTRECGRLAGLTPAALVRRWPTAASAPAPPAGVRSVQARRGATV